VTALPNPSEQAGAAPQFTSAEEALWAAFVAAGSAPDREKLFRYYQPMAKRLAASFVRNVSPSPLEFDELFQLSCTGLLESIDRFKPELGVPFRYFASRRISGAILNGIAQYSEINQQISVRRRLERERLASLTKDQMVPLGIDEKLAMLGEIAAGLALGLMLEESRICVEGGQDPSQNVFETVAWKQMIKMVQKEIMQLPGRDRDVIAWHYLDGLPFDQIAKILNLSKGRVSQLHRAAIALLRKRLLKVGQFRIEG
jgi:RNA polymerase sigma factor FliA